MLSAMTETSPSSAAPATSAAPAAAEDQTSSRRPAAGSARDGALQSPLHELHLARGAKMADFGGWQMPLEYAGGGVVAEHTAVRERVGLFDVSHLGNADVSGPGAADFVNRCFTNDLRKVGPGKAQYTLCCEESGGVVDDLIQYLAADDEVLLVPNAANSAQVVEMLRAQAPPTIEVRNRHRDFAIIAIQGPRCDAVLTALDLPMAPEYMSFVAGQWRGTPLTVCRTGYTGERGYELVIPSERAVQLWEGLLPAAAEFGGLPCGLAARDTLRTEMGYALHGHELSRQITPVQARVGWAVGWKKPQFWGKSALQAEKAAGPRRQAWGLLATERGIPRADCRVLDAGGEPVGVVTSGTFSPTLRRGIALALLETGATADDEVFVEVRGKRVAARVTRPPFVTTGVGS